MTGNQFMRTCFGILAAAVCLSFTLPAAAACDIDKPQKIGIGTWPVAGPNQLNADFARIRTRWWYDWQPNPSSDHWGHIAMIWSPAYINYAATTPSRVLLTFNEPDNASQANMTPMQAVQWWPTLLGTGKRLSSPAVQTGNEIGSNTWLGQFMAEAARRNYRVDFMAVHYYSTDPRVDEFKRYLERIHEAYRRPIWVTEWALADWKNPSRITAAQQLAFFSEATEMMDDLPYVERHAWFGMYGGMDGWQLNSELIKDGRRTTVGDEFRSKSLCQKSVAAAGDDGSG